MYRGHALKFEWDLRFTNGSQVKENIIKFSEPIDLMRISGDTNDETEDLYSLPQTSLIYKDRFQNLYLIFIDSRMWLKVYNLTDYYVNYSKSPKVNDLVYKIDLYKKLGEASLVDPERTCNNLI